VPGIHFLLLLVATGYGPCPGPIGKPTVLLQRVILQYIVMSLPALLTAIPHLQNDTSNWAIFAMRFRKAMEAMHRWGHFDGTTMCPVLKDAAHLTNAESQTIKEWEKEDRTTRYHLSRWLPDHIFIGLIDHKTAKGRWDQLAEELGQPAQEASRTEGLTGEPPAATAEGSSRRRRRRMGKRRPADAIHIADIEGEGCSLAEEGDTHAQIVSAEVVLSRQHPQTPDPIVHAQTVGTELEAILGEPGAIEEGAHAHDDRAEPDLKEGQLGDPNANTPEGVAHPEPDSMREETETNTPAHLEGMGPDALMEEEDDRLLEVEEDGAARKAASVEGDAGPHVELQDPGVSCLATQENARPHTLPSPMSPTTLEAASMQRSLAVDTEMPAIPVPDHGADLEPQPHDAPPLPNEAAEHPIHQPPEQIRAPTEVGGPLESLPGEASQRAMGQMVLTSAHTLEGKTPIGEAHGRPPDTPNLQWQGSTAWEPMFAIPKACVRVHEVWRPVLDEGACMRPDPWPSPGIVIINPDTCIGSALQLEGEQNIHIPSVGSKLHAAPPTPQHFSLSPSLPIPLPLDTLARKNAPRGEGAATKQRTIEDRPRPEPPKPPDLHIEVLEKAGGALPVASAVPALAKDTVGVGPADKAETASAAKPKALVSWAQEAGRRREVNAQPYEVLPQKGKRNAEALSRKRERRPTEGKCEPIQLPGEAPQNHKGTLEMPPRNHKRERGATPQGMAKRKVERLPQEGKCKLERPKALPPDGERERGTMPQGTPNEGICKPGWPPQEPAHKAVPTTSEGQGPWDLGGRPPRERTLDSKWPVEAMNIALGIVAHKKTLAVQKLS